MKRRGSIGAKTELWLKFWRWCRGGWWGLGLGWGPAQSTIWILRSCQTTKHTRTITCVPDHPRSQRPAGLRWWAGALAPQTTHTHRTRSHKNAHPRIYLLPALGRLRSTRVETTPSPLPHTRPLIPLLLRWERNHFLKTEIACKWDSYLSAFTHSDRWITPTEGAICKSVLFVRESLVFIFVCRSAKLRFFMKK